MTRTKIFAATLVATIALPAAASAHCGTMQGSFAVTCERGVQVYRHQALSSLPRGLTQAQAQVQVAKINQKTAQRQIAAQERASVRANKLQSRELAIEDYRARVLDRSLRNRSFGYSSSRLLGYNSGLGSLQPIRVKPMHRRRAH